MMTPKFQILLCTNGSRVSRPALEYGVWLAKLLEVPVLLLGILESSAHQRGLQSQLEETAAILDSAGVPHHIETDTGRGSLVIARYTRQGDFLTVVGPLGRPIWRRFVQGRSFRRLLARIETPILYVPKVRLPIRHILLCMGGLGYALTVERQCIELALVAHARITLLHVVEPVSLDYPVAKQVHEHWKEILATDTPQGQNLRKAIEDIQNAGLESAFKVRQGNTVHEILDELKKGDYDLIGLGSPYSAHSLRHLYLPNVTAEVAEVAEYPVLTARMISG